MAALGWSMSPDRGNASPSSLDSAVGDSRDNDTNNGAEQHKHQRRLQGQMQQQSRRPFAMSSSSSSSSNEDENEDGDTGSSGSSFSVGTLGLGAVGRSPEPERSPSARSPLANYRQKQREKEKERELGICKGSSRKLQQSDTSERVKVAVEQANDVRVVASDGVAMLEFTAAAQQRVVGVEEGYYDETGNVEGSMRVGHLIEGDVVVRAGPFPCLGLPADQVHRLIVAHKFPVSVTVVRSRAAATAHAQRMLDSRKRVIDDSKPQRQRQNIARNGTRNDDAGDDIDGAENEQHHDQHEKTRSPTPELELSAPVARRWTRVVRHAKGVAQLTNWLTYCTCHARSPRGSLAPVSDLRLFHLEMLALEAHMTVCRGIAAHTHPQRSIGNSSNAPLVDSLTATSAGGGGGGESLTPRGGRRVPTPSLHQPPLQDTGGTPCGGGSSAMASASARAVGPPAIATSSADGIVLPGPKLSAGAGAQLVGQDVPELDVRVLYAMVEMERPLHLWYDWIVDKYEGRSLKTDRQFAETYASRLVAEESSPSESRRLAGRPWCSSCGMPRYAFYLAYHDALRFHFQMLVQSARINLVERGFPDGTPCDPETLNDVAIENMFKRVYLEHVPVELWGRWVVSYFGRVYTRRRTSILRRGMPQPV